MTTIREVREADISALALLATKTFSDAFGHTFSPAELAKRLKTRSEPYFAEAIKTDTILVAQNAGDLIGYIQFGSVEMELAVDTTDRDQELKKLYVLSDHQGRGIGKSLLDATLNTPRLRHAKNIYLDVWYKNKGARKLYESYGFKVINDTTQDLIMVRTQP